MSEKKKYTEDEVELWDCNESEDLTYDDEFEAISSYLDACDADDLPETIEVTGYVRVKVKPEDWMHILDRLIEDLDDEYGDPHGGDSTPFSKEASEKLRKMEKEFVTAVLDEYVPWMCEPVLTKTIDVEEWIKANEPERLEE